MLLEVDRVRALLDREISVGNDRAGRPVIAVLTGRAARAVDAASSLAALVADLVAKGNAVHAFDASDDPEAELGAEADARSSMARLVLTSKGHSLRRLTAVSGSWSIDPPYMIARAAWQSRRAAIAAELLARHAGPLIVRSSHRSEDGWRQSCSGAYLSVADAFADAAALGAAIDQVFASYPTTDGRDEVFVQRFLTEVAVSGVCMTRHPDTGAPYLVVAFDRATGATDLVTSGSGDTELAYVGWWVDPEALPPPIREAHRLAADLVQLLGEDALDIEFAADHRMHLLQVRPIPRAAPVPAAVRARQATRTRALLDGARGAYRGLAGAAAPVVGARVVYSSMSDWNPAEMIGRRPAPLARSLYEALITDRVWAAERARLGYRDLGATPLMRTFAGHSYIDLRASLSSFLPAGVPEATARRLVDAQLAKLAGAPHLDDRIEFEIAETCLRSTTAAHLAGYGLAGGEVAGLVRGLRAVTVQALHRAEADFEIAADPRWGSGAGPDLGALLAACREGTSRFARLARAAFVATALLRDLVARGALSAERADEVLRGVVTVTGEMKALGGAVARGAAPFGELVRRYGHLRAGTYDIRVPRYDSDPEHYLRAFAEPAAADEPRAQLTAGERAAVDRALTAIGLPWSGARFLALLDRAIRGREYGKLAFTRPLSAALEVIAGWGAARGLSRDELHHLELASLLGAVARPGGADPAQLRAESEAAQELGREVGALELPDVISSETDFDWHLARRSCPSFITSKSVRAPVVVLAPDRPVELAGKIVLSEKADPGYDWLFSRRIAGLITAYGGVNSHMGVRCVELGVPAAIGVGQQAFRALHRNHSVLLDCGSRRVVAC